MSERLTPQAQRWLHARMALILIGVMAGFGAVLHRLHELQIVDTDLAEIADEQVAGKITLGAGGEQHLDGHRGYIYDRNGFELAISVEVPSLFAHPKQIEDKAAIATELARILPMSEDQILAKIGTKGTFVWVARKITPEQGAQIEALNLPGVGLKRESKRYYPGQTIGGQIVGFAGVDNVGLAGVEAAFDDRLRGTVLQLRGLRDARGQMLLTLETPRLNDLEGASVVLTIDQYIQRVTETAIERAAVEYGAKRAMGIVMDPKTGEVLALANWPSFNPNRFRDYAMDDWRNRAIVDVYEPGSVFKAFLYAAALDMGVVKPDTPIDQEKGRLRFSDEVEISDTHLVKDLNAESMVVHSSNIGAYKVAKAMGRQAFYESLQAFGFGSKTGIGVTGESAGILWPPKQWAEVTFANIAFGQGISVSPIQLAAATSALANGGTLMRPLLVKEVRDRSGQVVMHWQPEVRRKVVSEDAARAARMAMEKVVTEGTAMRGWVEGYRVGGKTGTPQKVDSRTKTYGNRWMANFVGIAPIDNPDLAIVIMMDEPRKSHLGGIVAAPVFAEIVSKVLPYRGVYPDKVYAGDAVRFPTLDGPQADTPEAAGLGDGDVRVAAATLPSGAMENQVVVPDFRGKSLRDALALAADHGVDIEPEDIGFVVDQWPAAGSVVETRTKVQLTMAKRYRQSHLGFVR